MTGLTADDFELFEDEQPREIAAVSMVNLASDNRGRPIRSEGEPPASSQQLLQSDDLGRVYVMVLNSRDAEHVDRVRRIAREFIDEYLGPTDLMAVMHGNRAATPGLTNDREVLRLAAETYRGSGGSVLKLLKELAVNLNAVRGRRKAILYVGDEGGIRRGDEPSATMNDPKGSRARQRDYDDAVSTAVRNNVRIYPIDPRGYLVRFDPLATVAESHPVAPPTGPVASGLGEGMDARILASDTGGIAIVNTGNFRGNFGKIVRDNNGYYVIAFYSSASDGRSHSVKIRVKGRPTISVRSRSGYRATSPDIKGRAVKIPQNLSASAGAALASAKPAAGTVPIEIFTAVFRGEGFDGSLLLGCHVPGGALDLTPGQRIELSYVAVDRWGVTRAAERRAFTLTLSEDAREQARRTGLRLFGRLRLPRGYYELRVAVHQPGTGTGAAFTALEIPDYTELPLSIGDLVVASSHSPTMMTLEDDAVLRRALPAQPTPIRRFRSEDTLSLFSEIYNSLWALTPNVGVTTVIRSKNGGRVIFRDERKLGNSDQRGRLFYQGRVPLTAFTPGEYLLVLEAYTLDGIPASASQQMEFEVKE